MTCPEIRSHQPIKLHNRYQELEVKQVNDEDEEVGEMVDSDHESDGNKVANKSCVLGFVSDNVVDKSCVLGGGEKEVDDEYGLQG